MKVVAANIRSFKVSAVSLLIVILGVSCVTCDRKEKRGSQIPDGGGIARGPSSTQDSYLVPYTNNSGVFLKAIISVGVKADNGYEMVGIPDGLGAYDNWDNTFTVVMAHEIAAGLGAVRKHGANGAFVSKWKIQKNDFKVVEGEDLIKKVFAWDRSAMAYKVPETSAPVTMSRFCSATLAPITAFFNPKTGKGTVDRIFMNGEENGIGGRAFAHVITGPSAGSTWELPRLGQGSFENAAPHPGRGDKTVVNMVDDNGHNRVFVYVGDKQKTGSPVEKAGLTNGKLYVIAVDNLYNELGQGAALTAGYKSPFKAILLGNGNMGGAAGTGAAIQANYLPFTNPSPPIIPNTKFDRPEDGSWDPSHTDDFYFITTASYNGAGRHSRLWRLRFEDPTLRTSLSGEAEILINGPDGVDTSGPKMMDNLCVTRRGDIVLQEDIGGQPALGRVWRFNERSDVLEIVAQHNPAFFSAPTPLKTVDEESSGVIPLDDVMRTDGWYLLDVQAHKTLPAPYVEDGQLLVMYLPRNSKH